MSTVIWFASASMMMVSPSSTKAIGPPSAASGVTWPTTKPWLPPEKRPSVIRATELPRPFPIMAEVGLSISRIPGPPRHIGRPFEGNLLRQFSGVIRTDKPLGHLRKCRIAQPVSAVSKRQLHGLGEQMVTLGLGHLGQIE